MEPLPIVPADHHKGRGAQHNPPNRFLNYQRAQEHWEALDELPATDLPTEYRLEYPREIVNRVDSPDVGMQYSLNPYQGCEHGCVYCYARPTHEYWGYSAGQDFERIILVKPEAPKLLSQFLQHPKWLPVPIALSGNTDCYQPAERKFGITRQLLEVFWAHRHPVSIITKNALILRDMDIIEKLAAHQLVHVAVSITGLDEALRQKLEPRTVPYARRLEVIRRLSASGVPVTLMCAPIIPGLNSHEVPKVIEAAAQAGAINCGHTVVRLNGAVAGVFTEWLRRTFPDRAQKVLGQIEACHGGSLGDSRYGTRMVGEGVLAQQIAQWVHKARQRYMNGGNHAPYNTELYRRNPSAPTLFG